MRREGIKKKIERELGGGVEREGNGVVEERGSR